MLVVEAIQSYFELLRATPERLTEDTELKELVVKATLGNQAALGDLYMRYRKSLFKVARAKANNSDDAEDAVNDVFLRIAQGKFAGYGQRVQSGEKEAKGIVPLLMRSVINAVKNAKRSQATRKAVSIGGGGDDDDRVVDPAAPEKDEPGLTTKEREVVRSAVDRAIDQAKLTPQERDYVSLLLKGDDGLADITELGKQTTLAKKIWPEKKDKTAIVHARRVTDRFLKQFCTDKSLCALLPSGKLRDSKSSFFHAALKPACKDVEDSCIETAEFAFSCSLVESAGAKNPDAVAGAILEWIRARI